MLIGAILFLSFGNHSMETVWAFFTTEKFKWSGQLIGLSLGFMGLSFIIAQAWFVGFVVERLKDKRAAYLGLLLTCLAFLCFALAPWQWGLFIGIVLLAMGSIADTALQGILSNNVPADEQGEL